MHSRSASYAAAMRGATVLAGCCLAAAFLVGCSSALESGSWSDGGGLTLLWTPAEPRFGDLVRLEASWSGSSAGDGNSNGGAAGAASAVGGSLYDPAGTELRSVKIDNSATGVRRVWDFRAKVVGPWTWGKNGQVLWKVETVAGSATEFKTVDAQGLWEGRQ